MTYYVNLNTGAIHNGKTACIDYPPYGHIGRPNIKPLTSATYKSAKREACGMISNPRIKKLVGQCGQCKRMGLF